MGFAWLLALFEFRGLGFRDLGSGFPEPPISLNYAICLKSYYGSYSHLRYIP